jgi:hypothetical protein
LFLTWAFQKKGGDDEAGTWGGILHWTTFLIKQMTAIAENYCGRQVFRPKSYSLTRLNPKGYHAWVRVSGL